MPSAISRRWGLPGCIMLMQALTITSARAGDPAAGRLTFVSICSSCHGLDGIATYEYAPSFAKGQRLNQDDETLLVSVRDGLGRMPPWGVMLSDQQILDAIAYARTLQRPQANPPRQDTAKH